jgi:hypothetical protein
MPPQLCCIEWHAIAVEKGSPRNDIYRSKSQHWRMYAEWSTAPSTIRCDLKLNLSKSNSSNDLQIEPSKTYLEVQLQKIEVQN